jgi:hypothetical protein
MTRGCVAECTITPGRRPRLEPAARLPPKVIALKLSSEEAMELWR